MTKDDKLRKKILSFNRHTDNMDIAIDEFVSQYDSGEWCRGRFKSQIAWLVLEAKKEVKQ